MVLYVAPVIMKIVSITNLMRESNLLSQSESFQ